MEMEIGPRKALVVGIYGSPRKKGNTDLLLDALMGSLEATHIAQERIYVRDLKIRGCIECGKCDETGQCAIKDEMQGIYPLLERAQVVILSSPVFFYGLTSQAKALVDRTQAMWARKRLGLMAPRQGFCGGYLLSVGATRGKNLFSGVELEAKYFFDALDLPYLGGLFFRQVEKKGDILKRPGPIEEALDLGRDIWQRLKGAP